MKHQEIRIFIRVWNVYKAFLKSLLDEGVAKAGGGGIVVNDAGIPFEKNVSWVSLVRNTGTDGKEIEKSAGHE